MRAWHFSEQAYTPFTDYAGPIRLTVPSSVLDPAKVREIKNLRFEEWLVSDDLGMDIMVNEHHATTNTMGPSVLQDLGALARQTKKARLLALGCLITNRTDPLRVAEEFATIDVLSEGRLDLGLVRGANWEPFASSVTPVRARERYEEAFDFIVKAMTTHTGPFTWEGEFFQYRMVNCFPRPWQIPMPPMWIPGHSTDSARWAARKKIVFATFLCGYLAKILFAAYRDEYHKVHGEPAPDDRLAYLTVLTTAHSEAQATERANALRPYLASLERIQPWAASPPGYQPPAAYVQALRKGKNGTIRSPSIPTNDGKPLDVRNSPLDYMAANGMLMSGTPDQVVAQIDTFRQGVGGFGHLLFMPQCHLIEHRDVLDSLKLFAAEIYPRMKEFKALN